LVLETTIHLLQDRITILDQIIILQELITTITIQLDQTTTTTIQPEIIHLHQQTQARDPILLLLPTLLLALLEAVALVVEDQEAAEEEDNY
jgi:hypothetical protein